MKNKAIICLLSTAVIMGCMMGCGKGGDETETTSSTVSVSEDIANKSQEEIVPKEATIYTTVSFDVPEGYEADTINDEYHGYYLSTQPDNLSYIAYTRNERPIDYVQLSKDEYEEAFLKKYAVDATILEFEEQKKEDYDKTTIVMEYKFGNTSFYATEYIFATEEYIFTVSFCQDLSNDVSKAFAKSEGTLTLNSVVASINDKDTPEVAVSANAILTDEEVLDKINAGASLGE